MKNFYLGIDIGTNSVGIAGTDENYDLLRASGKDCWAVRLFDASLTAVDRRMARTARRRLVRRKQRIFFLQSLFSAFIADKTFFIRLQNSQYLTEDKSDALNNDVNNLFADKDFKDKDYHKTYPTIYHLRKALMTEPITDLRLYYLALHHIIKYRGHFLFEGSVAEFRDAGKLFDQLNAVCIDLYEENVPRFDSALAAQAKEILLRRGKDREKCLTELFGVKDNVSKEIIKGVCGYKITPKKLFPERYKEEKSFSMEELSDEIFEAMQETYGDDYALLERIRAICNYVRFERLLDGQPDFSSAMIKLYDKHARDLKQLKEYIHGHADRLEYNRFFKSTDESYNYANYIGYSKKGGDKKKVKVCSQEEFYKYTEDFLKKLSAEDDEEIARIKNELNNKSFMPKILHADNGLIPHQINEDELKKIVDNMVKNCPQTKEIAEKILPLFLYRIPYFVGPLAGVNSWAVRREGKENEPITPWNFKEVIDEAGSNEEFMRRMTNKCSYLYAEDVLPKASVYYQCYDVLNQINKLKINDQAISVDLKQKIFNELFLKKKKVTDSAIKDLLIRSGQISQKDKESTLISGKDGELKATMSSYIQLKNILGDFVDEDLKKNGGVCENIILWHTLNTEKRLVADLIMKNYGNIPVIAQNIKALKGLVFKDFGRFSKRFLCGIKAVDKETGEYLSVLDILYQTNNSLNELLYSERYNWQETIREENGETTDEVTYEDIKKLYVSPAVHRGIWQTLKMTDEYVRKIGKTPDKIFVEVTRTDGVKGDAGRKFSRKKQLQEKYKGIEGIESLTAELNEKTDLELRSERLYLYFRQLGRCMYSGKRIDLSALSGDQYDVDHILPRTYIKDDSLDNKVLVLREKNAEKKDIYPIPSGLITEEARKHQKILHEKGMISDETYKRLTRTDPLNDDDYNDFINRQKTITDQTAKAVIELLARKYPSAKIVYSKAKDVNDFKQNFDLYKCRETNDLHHARDAYLNIVVGNVFDTCFSTPMARFRKDGDRWRVYNLKTMFKRTVKGAWEQEDKRSIVTVKKVYAKTSMCVTRYSYCNKGGFYKKLTILPKGESTIPLKGKGPLSDPKKYGGRMANEYAYQVIVSVKNKKGAKEKYIHAIPVLVALQEKQSGGAVDRYLKQEVGLKDYELIVSKLKINSMVLINGYPFWTAGGGSLKDPRLLFRNALQFYSSPYIDRYVSAIVKLKGYNGNKEESEYLMNTNRFGDKKVVICKEENIKLYKLFVEQLQKNVYKNTYNVFSAYETLLNFLSEKEQTFIDLTVYNQASVLLSIISFLKADSNQIDLKLLDVKAPTCLLRCKNNITDVDFRIVHQSPCGLTERLQKV